MKKSSKETRTFESFAEYLHLTKDLPEYHRQLLIKSLSKSDSDFLKKDFDKGGWQSFFNRLFCDEIIDQIKSETGVDLIDLRIKIIKKQSFLVHRALWKYVCDCFDSIGDWSDVSYIFDGIKAVDFDSTYVKLSNQID